MGSTSGNHDQLVELLASVKDNFWLEHEQQGLAENDIRQLWTQQYVGPVLGVVAPSNTADRSGSGRGPAEDVRSTPRVQGAFAHSHAMERRQTDQPRSHYSPVSPRKRANSSSTGAPSLSLNGVNLPSFRDATPTAGTSTSSRKMQRTASGGRPLAPVSEVKVYEVDDYLRAINMEMGHGYHAGSLSRPQNSLPIGISVPVSESPNLSSPASSSFTRSVPLTPDSAGIQNGNFFPSAMSRQDSLGVVSSFAMVRLDSNQLSNTSDYASARPHRSFHLADDAQGAQFPKSPLPGPFQQSIAVSAPLYSALRSYNSPTEDLAFDARITPTQGAYRTPLRPVQSERPLAPKLGEGASSIARFDGSSMIRIESENGVSEKCQISKTPYTRPQREKIKCTECDSKPEGFRGEHELRRHQKLNHKETRTGWICVDVTPDGSMLGSCKHCQAQKVYGAYYNAAAHLRRVHFHPRKDGRRARGHVSRAGKGGGDDPPMEELKRWMKKVEVNGNDASLRPAEEGDLSSESPEEPMPNDSLFPQPDLSFPCDFGTDLTIDDMMVDASSLAPGHAVYPCSLDEDWDIGPPSLNFVDGGMFAYEPYN